MTEIATNLKGRFAATRAAADLPHNCHCGARWSGSTTCHCGTGGCHVSFSSVGSFSRHRRDGHCLDPQTVGMSLVPGRAFPCWGYPADTTQED